MYAVLGNVQFKLITYFEGMDAQFAADYAEHALIGGKPRLQAVGAKLDELRLQLAFHAAYCNPEAEVATLRALVQSREARQFVLGSGLYRGWYVLTELAVQSRQTDERGRLITVEASATLREYVEPQALETRRIQAKQKAKARRAAAPKKSSAKAPAKPAGAGRGWINDDGSRAPKG